MKATKKRRGLIVIMGAVTAFLAAFCLWNCKLVVQPLGNLLSGSSSFTDFTQEINERYLGRLSGRERFINLNGAFSAALGQRSCNDVVKLDNGLLTVETSFAYDFQVETANNIIAFDAFLDAQGIPFLYVQQPSKMDLQGVLLPPGVVIQENENSDVLLRLLADAGSEALDLRPALSATPELAEAHFFKTDHHWNFDGAFAGFQLIVRELQRRLPDKVRDISWTDPAKWESHALKNWFLGSWGRRVGIYFGGTDDVVYYTPKGDPMKRISCAMPANGEFQRPVYRCGGFSDALIFENQLDPRNYFHANPYALYLNNDHPMVQVRNPDAPNPMRVLFVNNSFGLPLISYFSTLFQEVDAIDPRYYTGSIPGYAQLTHPDIVIQIGYLSYDAGANVREPSEWIDIPLPQDIEIRAQESGCASLPLSLDSGRTYVLTFDDLEFLSGDSQAAVLALYDERASVVVDSAILDLDYNRSHGGFAWCFTVPKDVDGELKLQFYAGLPENWSDNFAAYRNVRLRRVS